MTKHLVWAFALFLCGCTNTAIITESADLQHESKAGRLLAEEEFFARASQSADLIYEGMSAVRNAVSLYLNDNDGALPSVGVNAVKDLLLDQEYIDAWPVVPSFAFTDPVQKEIKYFHGFGDTDNNGVSDDVINLEGLKNEVCQDFVRRYASPGFGDKVYDYEASRKRYPAETIGRHIKIFAVNWSMKTEPDYCEIVWIVRYEGFPDE